MSIVANEIIWRKATVNDDTSSNGGRMTATAITSAVKNNLWPDVSQSERSAGSTKYRKAFIQISNDADLALLSPKVFVETYTPGDDSVVIFAGTQTDTQGSMTETDRYGSGQLNVSVSPAATSIDVLVESPVVAAALNIFRAGMTIRISDKPTVDGAGNEEFHVISGAPTYVGDVATINLVGSLANGYSNTNTRVAGVWEPADIKGAYSSFVVTSGLTGTYNDTTYPIAVDHIGGIQQNWTLTFTGATTFDVTGDTLGAVGSGNVSSDLQPSNGAFGKPYFVMLAAGYGGTFQSGDTITFTTAPASLPIWYRRDIPTGAGSLSADKVIIGIEGESA